MFLRSASFVARFAGAAACACLLTSVAAPPAVADEFSEYRIPAQSWQSGSGRFSVSGSRTKNGYKSSGSEVRSTSGYGAAAGSYRRGFDSDARAFSWSVASELDSDVNHAERVDLGSPTSWSVRDSRGQSQSQSLSLSALLRLNPGEGRYALQFDAGASGAWVQGWWREAERSQYVPTGDQTLSRLSTQRHDYDYSAWVSAATGLGRVRNVSVVEDVHVMEQRLRETGVLVRPLSAGARARLAQVIAAAGAIGSAHERPERYRWREIERVFAEDGALGPGGLGAYSLLRAAEGASGRVYRARGYFVGPVLQVQHDHRIYRIENQDGTLFLPGLGGPVEYQFENADRIVYEFNRAYVGGRAEWHRPVGWAWQWDADAQVLVPARPGERGASSSAQLGGSWHVADRWLASLRSWHTRRYYAPRDFDGWAEDAWSTQQEARLEYFLEDHLSLSVSLADRQFRLRQPGYSGTTAEQYNHDQRLSAGIGWRFLGRAEAPGLFGPLTSSD